MRLAEVAAQNNLCTVIHQILDCGKCTVNTVFVGDDAVLHGHVKVHADKTFFAFYVYISDCHFVHDERSLFRQLPDYIFIAASRPTLTGESAMLPCLLPRAEPQIPVASVRFFRV